MEESAIVGAVALVALAVYGYVRMFTSGRNAGHLREVLPRALLIDVRTAGEYRTGHLDGAINIPLDRLSKSASKLGEKNAPKVLYCASGSRARQAVRILRSMGHTSVYSGGTMSQLTKISS